MTEEIPAAPGWIEGRLDEIFAELGGERGTAARERYLNCLSGAKSPAAPSDLLGAECERCRRALLASLQSDGVAPDALDRVGKRLEEMEAELAADS